MSRTALPVLCGLSHGILPKISEIAAFIFLSLQMRKLRLTQLKVMHLERAVGIQFWWTDS